MQVRKTSTSVVGFVAAILLGNNPGNAGDAPSALGTSGSGYVVFLSAPAREIVSLTTKLLVPPEPAHVGTLFLWPGLQPGGVNYLPIDNGILQPVLTWGPSCAPGNQPAAYSTWWISGQYVNTYGHYAGYTNCHGGPIMRVNPGDVLLINISLWPPVWSQTILDLQSKESVSFHISLENQSQNYAWFSIESDGGSTISNVIFNETTITFSAPDPLNCQLGGRDAQDFITTPIVTDDGRVCYVEKVTLNSGGGPSITIGSCRKEGAIKSIERNHPTTIAFRNDHGSAIKVYWIDHAGHRKFFAVVNDGQSYSQPTYLTNPWIVTDLSDICINLYLPSERPHELVVR